MAKHTDAVRLLLSRGRATARQLAEKLGISQPTVSRALTDLGAETFRLGVGRAIQYALRDPARGLPEIPVRRISDEGKLSLLGTLIPVRPEGFVMQQEDGYHHHSEGLPWWLFDMRPQGFLGRAYATRHAAQLGLPQRLSEWNDTHALRALLAHGHDAIGNLLLGDQAREQFLSDTSAPIAMADKAATYHHLAVCATCAVSVESSWNANSRLSGKPSSTARHASRIAWSLPSTKNGTKSRSSSRRDSSAAL